MSIGWPFQRVATAKAKLSTFPASFETALVRPLLMKPSLGRDIVSHSRPLLHLTFLGKVLERIAAMQLIKHMRMHGLCEWHQSESHCFHSTEAVLIKVQNDLLRALDTGCSVFLVYLDLFSAFDTLNNTILLRRLEESVGMSRMALQ